MQVSTIVGFGSQLEHRQYDLKELHTLHPYELVIAMFPVSLANEASRHLNGYLRLSRIGRGLVLCHNNSLPVKENPFSISGPLRGSGARYYCNDPKTGVLIQELEPGVTTSPHYHKITRETFLGLMGECYLYRCGLSERDDLLETEIERIVLPRNPIQTETRTAHQLKTDQWALNVIICDPPLKDGNDHFFVSPLVR